MAANPAWRVCWRAGESVIDRVLCVAGAVVFSQGPEFMQQYLQRLGGHLDEARRQLQQYYEVAQQSGLTLDRLIANARAAADPSMARLGDVMAGAVDRVHHLAVAESAIRDASIWTRPFVFLRHLDPAIAQAAWSMFKPAMPTTLEGLVYAFVGLVLFLAIYRGAVKAPAGFAYRRWQARRERRAQGWPEKRARTA